MKPHIGLVIPSRGLIMAECIEAALWELSNSEATYESRMPSGLPIPDCFNLPISDLLSHNKAITHIWIVEEDVVTPPDGLKRLLALDADVAIIDYPLRNGYATVTKSGEKILWCGTGCTLIKRHVFERLPYPYFRTDGCFWQKPGGIFEWKPGIKPSYGGHDIRFGVDVNNNGMRIEQVPGETARHLQLMSLGRPGTNTGAHEIKSHNTIQFKTIIPSFQVVGIDKPKAIGLL